VQAQHAPKFRDGMRMSNGMMTSGANLNMAYSNYPKEYRLKMLDSSLLFIRSKIYSDDNVHNDHIILENKKLSKSDSNRIRKIFPRETLNIVYHDTKNGTIMTGIPADSCWLFLAETGRLKLYTCYTPADILDVESINAFQVDEGPIQKWDLDKLKEVIAGNEKALKAFDQKRYVRAVRRFNNAKEAND
jgi:hypothetical protein